MFQTVIVDDELLKRPRLQLLQSAWWLIADDVYVADFRNTESTEYHFDGAYFIAKIEELTREVTEYDRGLAPWFAGYHPDVDESLKAIPHDAVILSDRPELKRMIVGFSGLDRQNCILILAGLGLHIPLTPTFFRALERESLSELRDALWVERDAYLEAVNLLADGAVERLKGGSIEDALRWGDDVVRSKILPCADAHARRARRLYPQVIGKSYEHAAVLDNLVPTLTCIGRYPRESLSKAISKVIEGKFREAAGEISAGIVSALLGDIGLNPLISYGILLKRRRDLLRNE